MVLLLLLLLLDVDGIRDKGRKGIPVAPVGLTACNFSRHEAIKNFFRGPSPLANRLANSRQSSQCSQRSNFCFSASFLFLFPACSLLHPSKSRDPAIIYTKGEGEGEEKKGRALIYIQPRFHQIIIHPRKEWDAIIQLRILLFLPTLPSPAKYNSFASTLYSFFREIDTIGIIKFFPVLLRFRSVHSSLAIKDLTPFSKRLQISFCMNLHTRRVGSVVDRCARWIDAKTFIVPIYNLQPLSSTGEIHGHFRFPHVVRTIIDVPTSFLHKQRADFNSKNETFTRKRGKKGGKIDIKEFLHLFVSQPFIDAQQASLFPRISVKGEITRNFFPAFWDTNENIPS